MQVTDVILDVCNQLATLLSPAMHSHSFCDIKSSELSVAAKQFGTEYPSLMDIGVLFHRTPSGPPTACRPFFLRGPAGSGLSSNFIRRHIQLYATPLRDP